MAKAMLSERAARSPMRGTIDKGFVISRRKRVSHVTHRVRSRSATRGASSADGASRPLVGVLAEEDFQEGLRAFVLRGPAGTGEAVQHPLRRRPARGKGTAGTVSFGRKSNARNPRPLSAVRKAVIGSRRVRGSYLAPTHPARLNRACLFADRARHRARASADGRGPRGRHRGPAHNEARAGRFSSSPLRCEPPSRERRAHARKAAPWFSLSDAKRVTVGVFRVYWRQQRAPTPVVTRDNECSPERHHADFPAKAQCPSRALRCPVECFFAFIKSLGAFRVFL